MKKLFTLALAASITLGLSAVPAKRITRTLSLASGATVQASLSGDENNNYWLGTDGLQYVEQADGTFAALSTEAAAKRQARAAALASEKNSRRALRQNANVYYTGKKKGIVILVNFKDKSMVTSQTTFNNAFNQSGYGTTGSVKDYFLNASYNQLEIDFDVVGPYTLANNMSYYGADNGSEGNDIRPGQMITEAVNAANASVNFADYDWDGDGYVDQVYVIYAGYGQAQGGSTNTVWPHEWDLASAKSYGSGGNGAMSVDGVIVNTYACSNELAGTSGSKVDGIGTACHEFSHCLGIPDMYDTAVNTSSSGTTNFGMDSWDLMDYGAYNNSGYTPAGYTSYERMFCGWLNPTVIEGGLTVTDMQPIVSTPEAYIIYNQANQNEYYLLENRQKTSWDAGLGGAGMLVIHVDYNAAAWENNTVNSVSGHPRVTIVPADNSLTSSSLSGDPWPRTGKTELTNTSTPAATLYNNNSDGKKYLNMPITQIKTSGGLISFVAGDGTSIEAPVALEASAVTSDGFTANWQATADADSYLVVANGTTATGESATLVDEDFSKLTSSSGSDSSNEVTSKLDSYMSTSGWTGEKVYVGKSGAKIGTGSVAGKLVSPSISATGDVTITVTATQYKSSENTLTVAANGTTLGTMTLGSDATTETFTTTASGTLQLTLTAGKRAYVSGVKIEAGAVETATIEGTTTDTSYTFTGLNPEMSYTYVVYALSGTSKSKASNVINVGQLSTGIGTVLSSDATAADAPLYDLSGRRVSNAAHGIYIQNGRKVIKR